MTPENTATLAAICPQGFRDLYASPRVTNMAFGVECGDGWFQPLADMCSAIQEELDASPQLTGNPDTAFVFSQIKEKFGGLRVYCYGANAAINQIILNAEIEARKTCEACGSHEGVGYTSGWIKTLCAKCAADAGKILKPWKDG